MDVEKAHGGAFASKKQTLEWFEESDILFVNYKSLKNNVKSVSYELRTELRKFYPTPYRPAINSFFPAREDTESQYEEIVLVGHSLGGLILRATIVQIEENEPDNPLLEAKMRLFSPAFSGFKPSGILKFLTTLEFGDRLLEVIKCFSVMEDLLMNSRIINTVRNKTVQSAQRSPGTPALHPDIAWASNEFVVLCEKYETDPNDHYISNTNHLSVCKPKKDSFLEPFDFVKNGNP